MGISVFTDDLSPRQRILDAAFSLVLEGGMESMQLRDVALRAQVSTRTLHQQFPSKSYLLLSALIGQAETADFFPDADGADPLDRLLATFAPLTELLIAMPHVAAGLISALVSPDELAVPLLRSYRDGLHGRAAQALAVGDPTPRDERIARAVVQVWFAALAGWVTGAEEP
ncbi:MAG: TetR/AcrR family transcriptional regulator, partial [Marmoricola sp.]